MVYKISGAIILLLAAIYFAGWLFNHVDAWVGVFAGIAIAVFTINFIYQQIKKHI